MSNKIKKITTLSIFVALLSIISPISFYIGIVPLSLSLFIIFIISSTFSLRDSLIIVCTYILIGFIGLPVFAGYKNGFEVFSNATFGYIIGYIPCVICTNLLSNINKNNILLNSFGMFIGTIFCYIFGTIFYMIIFKTSLFYAVSLIVLPFILFDLVKIILASIVSYNINKNIKTGSN